MPNAVRRKKSSHINTPLPHDVHAELREWANRELGTVSGIIAEQSCPN